MIKEEITKKIVIYYSFLIAQDLWQAHYPNIVNNLSEGIHRINCKLGLDDKKCETCGIKYKYCNCFLEYKNLADGLIEYRYSCCNKNYQHKFDEKLKDCFFNI